MQDSHAVLVIYTKSCERLESLSFCHAKLEADNLLKSNQEVFQAGLGTHSVWAFADAMFQVTFAGPVTFTVVSAPAGG